MRKCFGSPMRSLLFAACFMTARVLSSRTVTSPSRPGVSRFAFRRAHSLFMRNRLGAALWKYFFSPSITLHSNSPVFSHSSNCLSVTSGIYFLMYSFTCSRVLEKSLSNRWCRSASHEYCLSVGCMTYLVGCVTYLVCAVAVNDAPISTKEVSQMFAFILL